MTERIDLKALKEAAEKVVAADGGLEASPAIDQFDYLCNAETALWLVAVVEAARAHVNDPPLMTQHLSWHEKYNDLVSALQPFTVTE
jgi:hypothetical protein